MDFVTHAAVGALCGRACSGEAGVGVQRRAARLGALVALAPDVDHALELVSAQAYLLHHRSVTHALLLAALAVLVAAAIPGERRRRAAIVGAALGSHLALDALTPFGTALLWPFAAGFASLDGLPLVCPWLALPALGLATWARRRGQLGEPSRHAATVGLAVVLALSGLGWGVARLGADAVAKPTDGLELAIPAWTHPLGAEVLVADAREVHHYRVGLISGEPERVTSRPRVEGAADWAAITTAVDAAGAPLERFRVPVATLEPDGGVVFTDAQFALTPLPDDSVSLRVDAAGATALTQLGRGGQALLWLLAVAATAWLGRTPTRAKPQPALE